MAKANHCRNNRREGFQQVDDPRARRPAETIITRNLKAKGFGGRIYVYRNPFFIDKAITRKDSP